MQRPRDHVTAPGSNSKITARGSVTKATTPGSNSKITARGSVTKATTPGSASKLVPASTTPKKTPTPRQNTIQMMGRTFSLRAESTPGSASKVTTPGSVSKVTTLGSAFKITTPGSVSKATTLGSASKVMTPGSVSKATNRGSASKVMTPGSVSKATNHGSASKVTTTGSASKITKVMTPGSVSKAMNRGSAFHVGPASATPRKTPPPRQDTLQMMGHADILRAESNPDSASQRGPATEMPRMSMLMMGRTDNLRAESTLGSTSKVKTLGSASKVMTPGSVSKATNPGSAFHVGPASATPRKTIQMMGRTDNLRAESTPRPTSQRGSASAAPRKTPPPRQDTLQMMGRMDKLRAESNPGSTFQRGPASATPRKTIQMMGRTDNLRAESTPRPASQRGQASATPRKTMLMMSRTDNLRAESTPRPASRRGPASATPRKSMLMMGRTENLRAEPTPRPASQRGQASATPRKTMQMMGRTFNLRTETTSRHRFAQGSSAPNARAATIGTSKGDSAKLVTSPGSVARSIMTPTANIHVGETKGETSQVEATKTTTPGPIKVTSSQDDTIQVILERPRNATSPQKGGDTINTKNEGLNKATTSFGSDKTIQGSSNKETSPRKGVGVTKTTKVALSKGTTSFNTAKTIGACPNMATITQKEADVSKTTIAGGKKALVSGDINKIIKASPTKGVFTQKAGDTTSTTNTTPRKANNQQGGTTTKATNTQGGNAAKVTKSTTIKAPASAGTTKAVKVAARPKPNPDAAKLESPFTWKLADLRKPREPIMDFLRNKLEKKVEYRDERNEGDSMWRVLVLNLVLCFETYQLGEKAKAHSYVEESVALVTSCVKSCQERGCKVTSCRESECSITSSPASSKCSVTSSPDKADKLTSLQDDEDLVVANQEAFSHVLTSCRYHLAGSEEERKMMLSALPNKASLSDQVKAALLGIRAAVTMEYGRDASCACIPLLEKAVNADPTGFQWLFLLAKCLGRRRRGDAYDAVEDVPYTTELSALESVVRLSGRPFHATFLAGACRGVAATLSGGGGAALVREVARLNDRAVQLYELAALAAPGCALTNIRCAEGYTLLPMTSHRNMTRAYELGKKAVELAPDNAQVNHMWGRVNASMGLEEKALRHFQAAAKAGSFKAHLDLLTLKMKRDKTYNPVPELEDMLEVFSTSVHHQEICSQLCSHCLLVLGDVERAVQWCNRVVALDPCSDKLTHHRPLSSPTEVNLYRLLMRPAQQASKEKRAGVFSVVVSACRAHYPELLQPPPSPSQILYEKVKALNARTRSVAEEILSREPSRSAASIRQRHSDVRDDWRAASGDPLNYERSWYWKERPGPRSESSYSDNWHSLTSYRVRPCGAASRLTDFSQIPPEIVWKVNPMLPRFLNGQEI